MTISDKVERNFRRAAMKRYGSGKGALSKAAESALSDWSAREDDSDVNITKGPEEDPLGAIEGLVKSVKVNSVHLQHKASKIRVKKARVTSSN